MSQARTHAANPPRPPSIPSPPPSPSPSPSPSHPLQPPIHVIDAVLKRRSADIGGLHRALRGGGQGQGWLGGSSSDPNIETQYAELLTLMYRETLQLVETNAAQNDPPELSPGDRIRLLKDLDQWYFEPLRMSEHEVLACVLFIFEVLFRIEGMKEAIKIDMGVIPRFIVHIRQMYRWQNHYHNFEHAVDVLQAIHCYLRDAGMVPPVSLLLNDANAPDGKGMWSSTRDPDSGPLVTSLTPHEIFALYLAAIGHDVAHPGFNNHFMRDAGAPIAQLYDNQSALEQMHSYLLLRTMRHHGLGVLLDDPHTGYLFRKILGSSVLATDMGVHEDFMRTFRTILDGATGTSNGAITWHSTRCSRQAFICQLLLKNADISNPCRPFVVSRQWASALQQEWSCQYKFELRLNIRHNVKPPSSGALSEAQSQVFFTKTFAKPLVDLTTIAIPEMKHISYRCAENLREWERIVERLQSEAGEASASTVASASTSSGDASQQQQQQPQDTPSPQPMSSQLQSPASASSSNPVSPRIMNPSTNDYSTAFRLTLPGSRSTTASNSGSIRRQPSGTSAGSVSLSPSLSRTTTTNRNGGAVNPQALATRTHSNSSISSSVSDVSSPIVDHQQQLQHQFQSRSQSHSDVDSEVGRDVGSLDDYRLRPGPPTSSSTASDYAGTNAAISPRTVVGSDVDASAGVGTGTETGTDDTDHHHHHHHHHHHTQQRHHHHPNLHPNHQNDRSFQTVMLAGLRRQRSNLNRISWCPGEPIPTTTSVGTTVGDAIEKWRGRLPGPAVGARCASASPSVGVGLGDSGSSLCLGEDSAVGVVSGNGRGAGAGSASGLRLCSSSPTSRAVAMESGDDSEGGGDGALMEGDDDGQEGELESEEDGSIPAGLVSAAPESEPQYLRTQAQAQTQPHPYTPPQQTGTLRGVDGELEGSPTPKGKEKAKGKAKGKSKGKMKAKEEEELGERDQDQEEEQRKRPKTDEERERMTRELIEEFEEEQRKRAKEQERGKEKQGARARSRSKAAAKRRRKGR